MSNVIRKIPLGKLTPHPDNPNRMSKVTFEKLVHNIERTGRYEPLIVRPIPDLQGTGDNGQVSVSPCSKSQYMSVFQIINGHHRWLALKELGYKTADAIVWDVDDEQASILLATLNRLCGRDMLDKKLALLKRLSDRVKPAELAKLLPQAKKQIEKLTNLHLSRVSRIEHRETNFLNPLVFFVSDKQQQIIENALSLAKESKNEKTKAAKNAAALTSIAQHFLNNRKSIQKLRGFNNGQNKEVEQKAACCSR